MKNPVRIASFVLAASLLAACGAKGPLFLPEKPLEEAPVAVPETPDAAEPADASDDVPEQDEDAEAAAEAATTIP